MDKGRKYYIFIVLVVFFSVLVIMYPAAGVILGLIYLVLRPLLPKSETRLQGIGYIMDTEQMEEEQQRRAALAEAKIFLAPYKDIWRNLRLSNKFCTLTLDKDGVTIKCLEKVSPYRRFQVTESNIHTYRELWNLFCIYFSYNKSYDGVVEDCMRYHVSIIESLGDSSSKRTPQTRQQANINKDTIVLPPAEKIDINNCSEIELTELPGISIVLAKKIIKKREEINGFKSAEEFFVFLKLKPHMENQLKNLIKTEKMRGSVIQKKHSERSVDF